MPLESLANELPIAVGGREAERACRIEHERLFEHFETRRLRRQGEVDRERALTGSARGAVGADVQERSRS